MTQRQLAEFTRTARVLVAANDSTDQHAADFELWEDERCAR